MRIVRDDLEGEVLIKENSELHGTIVGNATIDKNVTFRIYGTITGNLTLTEGATVYLHGVIKRDVVNQGGDLKVFGTIEGSITGEHTYNNRSEACSQNVG